LVIARPLTSMSPFYFMDYLKIYNRLVCKCKLEKRTKNKEVYYESHHIVPICLGGIGDRRNTNNKNIVLLTIREHILAHWLLHRSFPENKKLTYAFHLMCIKDKNTGRHSIRISVEAKQCYIESIKNRIPWNKDKKFPHKVNSGSFFIGMNTWNKELKTSEKTKIAQSESAKNRPLAQCPHCKKIANKSNMIQWHFDNCKYKN